MRRGRAARPAGAPAMRKLGHEGQSTYSTERESAFRSLCVETHSLCRNEYILRPAVAAVKRSGVLGCRNENFACETVRCPRCRNENFACETQTRTLSGPPSTGASIQEDRLLLLFNTTRMVPGPPSTGDAIAMDGGMADTACYYTLYVTVHYTSICNCTAHPLSYATPESNPTLPPPPTPRSPALHRTPGCALASCTSTPCKATI